MERYGATEDGGWEAIWHFKWWYVPIWYLKLLANNVLRNSYAHN